MRQLTTHSIWGQSPTNTFLNSQTLATGNVVVDVEVDIFYDALEYAEDDADGNDVIDVGKSPLNIRGGYQQSFGSDLDDSSTTSKGGSTLRGGAKYLTKKVKRALSPKRAQPLSPNRGQPPTPPLPKQVPQKKPQASSPRKQPPPPPPKVEAKAVSYDPPPPPKDLPLRFLRAGKGDPVEGQRRYEQTLNWRKEYGMDYTIKSPHPNFEFIKQHYPQYFHLRGRNNEPVWYEKPPKVNLKAMRDGGVDLDKLLRHYAMVTEFGWQYLETDDLGRSITVIDLEGIRMTDFAGEVVDFTRKCSAFTGDHYPERAGYVIVVNVPSWFKLIWNVVKGFVDEVTLKKISIVRGKKEVFEAMLERIPIENIPPEYGGQSMPLGQSPQEQKLRSFMIHNLAVANGVSNCGGTTGNPPCPYCTWKPVRSY